METKENTNLLKLFENIKDGTNGFNSDSVMPHLEVFQKYGSLSNIITEFGVETGCSTVAFLISGCKKMYSYDVIVTPNARMVKQAADRDGVYFRLYEKNNLKVKIKTTDLLFIDTDHWYGQIKAELEHHHTRVRKWIMMHDTETFGMINPFDGRPGMKAAIFEFLETYPEWKLLEHIEIGHGLTILERIQPLKRKWGI
jgi:hypothetical protein